MFGRETASNAPPVAVRTLIVAFASASWYPFIILASDTGSARDKRRIRANLGKRLFNKCRFLIDGRLSAFELGEPLSESELDAHHRSVGSREGSREGLARIQEIFGTRP
jgi:hypothetical protein